MNRPGYPTWWDMRDFRERYETAYWFGDAFDLYLVCTDLEMAMEMREHLEQCRHCGHLHHEDDNCHHCGGEP